MSSITRVEGWVSPGYLEQGPDAPRPGSTLPSSDITVSTVLKPSVERMFSEFKIPGVYSDWKYVTYLRVETDMNNGADGIYYGWVDSVDLLSDSDTAPMVLVKWHIDLWRTYLYAADLRQGHIVRKPSGNHPLQGYDYVRRTASKKADLFVNNGIWWVYIERTQGQTHKLLEITAYPVSAESPEDTLSITAPTYQTFICPSLAHTLKGLWDEMFGFDPKAVTGCWVSPVPPRPYTGTGTEADPISLDVWAVIRSTEAGFTDYGRYTSLPGHRYNQLFPRIGGSVSASSTEVSQLAVVNFDGEVIQEIPVGASLGNFTYRTAIGPTEAYIAIRFDGLLSRAEGLAVTIPLPSLDLSDNAWSSYVYSGNREYDKEMRSLQSMQSGVQGIASGALGGGIMGGFSGMGAAAGAVAGAATGAVGLVTDQLIFNQKIQAQTDVYRQKQSAGILMSGTVGDIISHGQVPCLISLDFDSYSASQASARDSQFGFSCSEFRSSIPLNTLTAGYWQIQGLNVQGRMPVEAKTYISRRFAAGVRLS